METSRSAISFRSLKSPLGSNLSSSRIFTQKNLGVNQLQNSIFEIYGIGYSHARNFYGNLTGLGFMVTESIAMTTNSVILDEEVAARSFAKFRDGEKRKFAPRNFFYTNRGLNFTLIAVSNSNLVPIEIREDFLLRSNSHVIYFDSGIVPCSIQGIDENRFSYSGGILIPPGTPLFSHDYHLQGIHHTSSVSYTFNIGTRIDTIIKILCNVLRISTDNKSASDNSLGRLLSDYALKHNLKNEAVENFGEGKVLYWIEWFNRNIYKYEVLELKWSKIKIKNIEQFLIQETQQWKFNWGSRLVYIPDGSFIVVGGVGYDLRSTRADVYHFLPRNSEIYRKKSMLERRDGPAIIYRQGFIYVVGGRYTYNTCEKYDISSDMWSSFSSMIHGRYEPVACLLQGDNYMYVAGGQPEESVGKTIERYNFSQDRWEGLQVVFPLPLVRCGIFPVTQTKFALLGGIHMRAVAIFEVVEEVVEGRTEEMFKVFEIEELPYLVETVYPIVYNIAENKVYLTKSIDKEAPSVLYYAFRSFLKISGETLFVFKKNLKLPPLFTRKNLLNERFPQ